MLKRFPVKFPKKEITETHYKHNRPLSDIPQQPKTDGKSLRHTRVPEAY